MWYRSKTWISLTCLLATGLICGGVAALDDSDDPSGRRLTIRYVLASPRACLIGPSEQLPASGGAENFARRDREIRIPAGTRVVFRLSRNTEGVWYGRSHGRLSTSLVLQMLAPDDSTSERQWIDIGRDAAGAVRHGPSIGHANVKVPYVFHRPGRYVMRGIIRTVAEPRLLENDVAEVEPLPSAVDEDIVVVRVNVVDISPDDFVPDVDDEDPDTIYSEPIPTEIDLADVAEAVGLTPEQIDIEALTRQAAGGCSGPADM